MTQLEAEEIRVAGEESGPLHLVQLAENFLLIIPIRAVRFRVQFAES